MFSIASTCGSVPQTCPPTPPRPTAGIPRKAHGSPGSFALAFASSKCRPGFLAERPGDDRRVLALEFGAAVPRVERRHFASWRSARAIFAAARSSRSRTASRLTCAHSGSTRIWWISASLQRCYSGGAHPPRHRRDSPSGRPRRSVVKKFLATLFLAAAIGSSVAASVAPAAIVPPGCRHSGDIYVCRFR